MMKNLTLPRLIWTLLVVVAAIAALWFTGRFGADLYRFFRCSHRVEGRITEWSVREIRSGEFHLVAQYNYRFQDINYIGTQIFKTPVFNNPHSAEYVLKRYAAKRWPVWVSQDEPNVSTLQRHFSVKLLVQALISIGVLIYFLWLKEYLKQLESIA